ncbi:MULTISPECIES: hypothetical protein [Streptomyces]|uniref:hypothetical protein n=1 Tax=Streptomyces TaxID=1883 RepID=UPI000E6A9469|nr:MULTISPECIES: hypothetical protein [Streptomyces]MDX3068959.1 hypothetical protein [Streptomyces sp. ND04-05B]MDX3519440.1 hypothetical protein [Streptomyces scabiei]
MTDTAPPPAPLPACLAPLRFWDRDRLAAVHGPQVWHRWGGRWVNYLFAEDTRPFTDRTALGRLWYPQEPDAVRFIPSTPAADHALPGAPVTAADVDGLVLAPGRSAVPYVLFPQGHREGAHHFVPAHEMARRLAELDDLDASGRRPSVSLQGLRASLLAILDGEEQATASFHRPAGRVYARRASALGTMTYVWVLSEDGA